jgi:amidase
MASGRATAVSAGEVLAALSLASDLGTDQPLEHGLRTAVLCARLAAAAGGDEALCADAYHLGLVHQPLFGPRYARGAWLDAQRLGRRSELERRTRGIVRVGARMERVAARARAKEAARAARINAIFDEHDVLMTPVTAAAPLPVGRYDGAGAARAFLGAGAFACYTAVCGTSPPAGGVGPRGLRRRRDADGCAARRAPRRRSDALRPRRPDRAGPAVGPSPPAGRLSALS